MTPEVEAKLLWRHPGSQAALRERLVELGCTCGPCERVAHDDAYVDTPRDELRHAGLAARIRHGDRGRFIEVKPVPVGSGAARRGAAASKLAPRWRPVVPLRRVGLRAPYPVDADPSDVLRSLLEREVGWRLQGNVSPRVLLEIRRDVFEVSRDALRVEVSLDEVVATAVDREPTVSFTEIELELIVGCADGLAELAEQLQPLGATPGRLAKYPRARELLGLCGYTYGPAVPAYDGRVSIEEVVRGSSLVLLETLRAHELGARIGLDPAHVHQMRVACRRLRNVCRMLPSKEVGPLVRDLEWLGRVLGDVRDLDVHLLGLARWRTRLGGRATAGWDALTAALERRSDEARARLLVVLDGERFRGLESRAERVLSASTPPSPHIRDAGEKLLRRRRRRLDRAIRRFEFDPSLARAHKLRIAAKRLRHALAFLAPLLTSDSLKPMRSRLKRFQDDLGELQDAASLGRVVGGIADEVLARGGSDPEFAFVLGQLAGAAANVAEHGGPLGRAALERLDVDRTRRALAKLVRRLGAVD